MSRPNHLVRLPLLALMETHETTMPVCPNDFNSAESRRTLEAAAVAVAHELGCEAARERFAELIKNRSASL